MKNLRFLAVIGASLAVLSACGVPSMIENTIQTSDGSRITVEISEPKLSSGLSNPVAHMLLLRSSSSITSRKSAFIEAAELKSGCSVVEDTFIFSGSINSVAAVELQC